MNTLRVKDELLKQAETQMQRNRVVLEQTSSRGDLHAAASESVRIVDRAVRQLRTALR